MSQKATIHDDGRITLNDTQIGTWEHGAGANHKRTDYTVTLGRSRLTIDEREERGAYVLCMSHGGPWRRRTRTYKDPGACATALLVGLADCWERLIREEAQKKRQQGEAARTEAAAKTGDASCWTSYPYGRDDGRLGEGQPQD